MVLFDLLPRDKEEEASFLERRFFRDKWIREQGYAPLSDFLKEKRLESLYAFSPRLVPTFFSKEKIPRWIGGMTWILEDGTPVVQLQEVFRKKKSFLGYTLEEVGAHEAVHAFRSDFEGNRFEEIFAYQTSHSPFRKFFGPLFRSTADSIFFLLTLIPPWFSPFGYLAPFLFLVFQILRLSLDRLKMEKARKMLKKIFPKAECFWPILVRMSEKEILFFGKALEEEVRKYLENDSLRWRQIKENYICEL